MRPMVRTVLSLLFLLALPAAGQEAATPKPAGEPVCVLRTSAGTMTFRFFEEDAPKTVAHIKKLVESGFFDGKPFYRVVAGHVIQAGDGEGTAGPKVEGEFSTRHPHVAGAVGLARDSDPNSGSTEIYICLAPRPHLDGKYAVFGQLIEGMDVLEKIGNAEVEENFIEEGGNRIAFHRPKTPVLIEKAWIETREVK